MTNATELLRWIYDDLERDTKLPLWLRDRVRDFLAAEEQYDALSERYVEGLGGSMKACKESFEREAERAKELITTPSDDAEEPVAWRLPYIPQPGTFFVTLDPVLAEAFEADEKIKAEPLYLHPPKPAEPEAEDPKDRDDPNVPSAWIDWDEDGYAFITIEGSGVPVYIHPPKPAEPEAEPYAWAWDEIMSDGLEPVADMDRPIDNEYRTNIRPLFLHPPRPEPARKPMTQEEIIQGVTVDTSDDFHAGYWAGIRFAEKHHCISGEDQ